MLSLQKKMPRGEGILVVGDDKKLKLEILAWHGGGNFNAITAKFL
jgi:hypothetical protein